LSSSFYILLTSYTKKYTVSVIIYTQWFLHI
jgi:hypothetical protein